MKNAVIVHGMPDRAEYFDPNTPSPSNHQWLPWLQKEFLMKGYDAQAPELPEPWHPVYERWKEVFERNPVGPETVLVGHSCGGGFLLRWLSEYDGPVKRAVLVAPWVDPNNNRLGNFFDFVVDRDLCSRVDLHILYSDNDHPEVGQSVDIMKRILPTAHYHLFPGFGHFCLHDMGRANFPVLASIALQEAKAPGPVSAPRPG